MLINCIVGLPGSGKTHLTYELALHYPPLKRAILDDIQDLKQLPGPNNWVDYLVISDPWFCRTSTRRLADRFLRERYLYPVEWIFFENDPQQCLQNIANDSLRNANKNVTGLIHMLSSMYEIPAGYTARPVWKPTLDKI